MYGGRPPQYGLTGAQPANAAPPDPYAQPHPGGASRATISGQAGTYTVAPGADLVIGRDTARCQVILQEPRISGVHATLHFENGQLFIRDDGSNNGTFLNNNRIAAGVYTPVPPGSMIRFGPIEFVVRMD
jgi:pSer/pThr/pTyr-binding forkhead associated (FHA) protein